MTWVQLDDRFPSHAKVLAAGDAAAWLYVCALCWAKAHLTDGHIPSIVVPELTHAKGPMKLAAKLVEVGLWERHENVDGYQIHDFAARNMTRAQVEAKRDEDAVRKKSARTPPPSLAHVREMSARTNTDSTEPVHPRPPGQNEDSRAHAGGPAHARPRSESEIRAESETEPKKTPSSAVLVAALRPLLPDMADLADHVPFWAERFIHLDLVQQVTEMRGKYGRDRIDAKRVASWLGIADARRINDAGKAQREASAAHEAEHARHKAAELAEARTLRSITPPADAKPIGADGAARLLASVGVKGTGA